MARKALTDGLVKFDESAGLSRRGRQGRHSAATGAPSSPKSSSSSDIAPWRLAVVLETGDQSARDRASAVARARRRADPSDRQTGIVPLEGVKWAKPTEGPTRGRVPAKVSQVLDAGRRDLCRAAQQGARQLAAAPDSGNFRRHRRDGPVDRPRAGDGRRLLVRPEPVQPRDPGAAPAGLLVQAVRLCRGARQRLHAVDAWCWTRRSRSTRARACRRGGRKTIRAGKFYGPSTLRFGIEHSRNMMTVRLAQDVGMPLIAEYAKRFGVYDDLPPYLSFSLGAGETTVLRMTTAYSMFANGGKRIKPTLIDRIQDRYGHTIYKHDQRECRGCDADKWQNQAEPTLVDKREQVIDPMTAYQITSMMEGVVQRGTATVVKRSASRSPARPAPPTTRRTCGSSASRPTSRSASIMGYDKPRHIGSGATGGELAAPIVARFHEGRAGRQAGGAVPRAGRHQADPHRSEDRHARRPGDRAASSSKRSSRAPRRPTPIRWSATPSSRKPRVAAISSAAAPRRTPTARCGADRLYRVRSIQQR